MATVVGPSFKVGGAAFEPPGWATASQADRDLYWQAVLKLVLKAKDSELKAGLDRYGKPMARLAPSTIANRRSAMGPADPGAPPLQPAHGLSRTRSLLTGKATASGVVCWWLVDRVTNATWGEILKHHRAGGGKLPKRDVIGLSPEARAQVKQRAFAWWAKHLAKVQGFDFSVGSAEVVVEAQAAGTWSGWHTAADVKAELKTLGIGKKAGGGYDFSAFWAKKKPTPPPPPPKPPSLPRRDPKPPTPAEPLGDYLPSDEDLAKPTASPFAFKPPKAKKAAPKKKAPKPAAAPTPPPAPPKPKAKAKPKVGPFPADLKGLVEVKTLGGSTGAKLVEDPRTGKRYVLKRGGNPGHLKNEAHADALYRAAGLDVPDSRLYDDGGPVKLAAFHEGKALGELMRSDPAAFAAAVEKLRKGFAADALLGNWDVVGMSLDNVLVLPDGRVLRIDNGGALAYRAQGALKTSDQWSASKVGELTSLRSTGVNPSAGLVYGPMTDDDVRAGIKELLKRRAKILAAAPDPATRAVLEGRLDAMAAWAKPAKTPKNPFPDGWKPSPASRFRKTTSKDERLAWIDQHYGDGKTSQWWKSLSAVEKAAVKDYSGPGYHDYNDWLRGKLKTKPHKIDERIANLDSALAKITLPEDFVVWRGISWPKPVYDALGIQDRDGLRVGMDIMDVSYSSASPNIDKAWSGLKIEVRLPKGSTGAYIGRNSENPGEEEYLIGREWDTWRIVEITPDWVVVEALRSKDLAAAAAKKAARAARKKGTKP